MRLESIVPNFEANTTQGHIDFYNWKRSSWVVLFSHPTDFSPMCTTELGNFAVRARDFANRNTKCLAYSIDDLNEHDSWIKDIKFYYMEKEIPFPYPIIADKDRELAIKFGMIDEEQAQDDEIDKSIRALFIIDPHNKLRLSTYYPMSCGRSVDEILRCVDSLQLTDCLKGNIATPANWTLGSEVVIIPTVSDTEAKKFFPQGYKQVSMPSGRNYFKVTNNYLLSPSKRFIAEREFLGLNK